MSSRSPTWARSCLNRSPVLVRTAHRAKRTRAIAPPVALCLATHATAAAIRPQFADIQPPRERTELEIFLRALQKRDASQIHRAFLQWTDILANETSPLHHAAVQDVLNLSVPTFSEIVRSIDPLASSSSDVAEGLKISSGETQYTAAGKLVDEYGVRDRHRQTLIGLQTLFRVRSTSTAKTILPADYEVAIRTAGAAMDFHAARAFWGSIAADSGLQKWRSAQTWNEFLKAFFLTEPLYYQFDRARVAVKARDLYRNRSPLPMATVKALDRIRLSISALQAEPWNRSLQAPDEDLTRELRKRVQFRGYRAHWIRALSYGHDMDEQLLCTSIKAFARSASLHAIKELILHNYYGIVISNDRDPTQTRITGGHDFPDTSPLKPTSALLEAIAEGYGSMSHIALAMQLIHFLSQRYAIPVPHAVWSSLLHWTYLFSSKPFATGRAKLGDWSSTTQRPVDVMHVWDAMTSPTNGNITPSFDDYDIYIKTLLVQRRVVQALRVMQEYALPHYRGLVSAYEAALTDEILQADAVAGPVAVAAQNKAAPRRATLRRQKAETLKDHTHHRITLHVKSLLKVISANRQFREGPVGRTLAPAILRDYGDFLPAHVKYRTAQGTVTFELDGDASSSHTERVARWETRWRTTLPAKRAGIYARGLEGSTEPEFAWPMVEQMRVRETRPVPKQRLGKVVAPPGEKGDGRWWDKLEEQMMI